MSNLSEENEMLGKAIEKVLRSDGLWQIQILDDNLKVVGVVKWLRSKEEEIKEVFGVSKREALIQILTQEVMLMLRSVLDKDKKVI